MDINFSETHSDCSSEVSETQSEREARIYSIVHHNDFSGTTGSPLVIDSKYGVEVNCNGEIIVFLKDSNDVIADTEAGKNNIPTIILDDDDMESPIEPSVNDDEFVETNLKKKKKKKKKNAQNESIEEYMNHIKETNALEEYKEKSGLNKIKPKCTRSNNVSLNVALRNERAVPMTSSEVLKQYLIGKPTECNLWYRCPKTWTSDMIKYYTKIQKSKRNFDCAEELKKIKDKYGSSPDDWVLNPIESYKAYSNTPRIKCNNCRQYGHTGYYCQEQYKPEVCIMCGMQGHNFHSCDKKLCFTCGAKQKKFTNNCYNCMSMSRVICKLCNDVGHESKYCTESWRQYHNIISTEPEVEDSQYGQSTSRSNYEVKKSNIRRSETVTSSFVDIEETSIISPNNLNNSESKKFIDKKASKRLHRLRAKKKHSKKKKKLSVSCDDNESINIDVNIQDVTLKRTLTKKNFLKNKKIKC